MPEYFKLLEKKMYIRKTLHDTGIIGTGEMAQKLRALAALAEDLGVIPSTHMAAHNCF